MFWEGDTPNFQKDRSWNLSPHFPKPIPLWLLIWLVLVYILWNKTVNKHSVFTEFCESFRTFKLEEMVRSSWLWASWLEVRMTSKSLWWCQKWGQPHEDLGPLLVENAFCIVIVGMKLNCRIPSWCPRINVSTALPAFMEG